MHHRNIVTGWSRRFFSFRMAFTTVLFFTKQFLWGKRSAASLVGTLQRLRRFKSKQGHGKFIKINGGIRIGLYVPTYPGNAFFQASENMFGEKKCASVSTAVISITSSCFYDCDYCYQKLNSGEDTPIETLKKTVVDMQNQGVALFVVEGGEPFSKYDRLKAVCETIDNRSEIWINTTGNGVTRERLAQLRALGATALKISIHHHKPKEHNRFLKSEAAWDHMKECVQLCNEMGVPYSFNSYMSKAYYEDGHFGKMMDLAKEWNASYIQCLTPRSAGGNLQNAPATYTDEELKKIASLVRHYNRDNDHREYPPIFFDDYEERCVIGCTAGGAGRVYLNAQGELQPCHAINITFGNIKEDSYDTIMKRMGTYFQRPHSQTACTVLTPMIAKKVANGASIPVPCKMLEKEMHNFSMNQFSALKRIR